MHHVTIDVPEEALEALKLAPNGVERELQMVAAVKLFELGRLSSGAAASLAGIPRTMFLTKLSDYCVATFQIPEDELRRDLENA